MSLDRLIDPISGDVQDAPGGRFVEDDEVANMIILSYSIDLSSWEGDPLLGHRFAELQREIISVETLQRVHDFAVEAVQWLLDLGLLDRIEVDVMEGIDYGPGIVAFQPRCYRAGASKPVAGVGLQYVSVGGT